MAVSAALLVGTFGGAAIYKIASTSTTTTSTTYPAKPTTNDAHHHKLLLQRSVMRPRAPDALGRSWHVWPHPHHPQRLGTLAGK